MIRMLTIYAFVWLATPALSLLTPKQLLVRRTVRTAASAVDSWAELKTSHTIMNIPPVRALMLTTAWKNDAENLRALGYTTKDTTHTIVQKSSAADLLGLMQKWSNQLAVISKMENPMLPDDHPLKETLTGIEVQVAMSSKEGNALAFYKTNGDCVSIEACLGNIALGTNEIAEEALVRKIVVDAQSSGCHEVRVKARVAPSGTTYLPPFYASLGFEPLVKGPEEEEDEDEPEAEVVMGWGGAEKTGKEKIGWGGMWTEADDEDALAFVLKI